MGSTKIEWTDKVWNPVSGCTKVSEGCQNCYAATFAHRFWGERKFTDLQMHPDRLNIPRHWKKPCRIFVNSMSDLFHPDVPDDYIMRVWLTMIAINADRNPWDRHTFIVLTKRPTRMYEFLNGATNVDKNIWLGVTVENQKAADERIPLLLQTPAAVRFVSIEPMLSEVNIKPYLYGWHSDPRPVEKDPGIDWVICGGETGPGARPMHPDWARSLRDQCLAVGVPFFFKQWGEWAPAVFRMDYPDCKSFVFQDGALVMRTGKKIAGRLLDGVVWNQFPYKEE